MEKDTISKIKKLLQLLTEQEREEVELEINEINNKKVYDFLENNGYLNDSYYIEYIEKKPLIAQNFVDTDLWYKVNSSTWIIVMYQIKELIKLNKKFKI